ncbi:helix-turn-helix domain-containing protein [Mucilaginibacter phyllosphaerae]
MTVEFITKDDLEKFRQTLLNDLKCIITKKSDEPQKYLKSYQVKNMLKISGGTLHTLRANGTLKFTRIGHIIYYSYEDIMQLMEGKPKNSKK